MVKVSGSSHNRSIRLGTHASLSKSLEEQREICWSDVMLSVLCIIVSRPWYVLEARPRVPYLSKIRKYDIRVRIDNETHCHVQVDWAIESFAVLWKGQGHRWLA